MIYVSRHARFDEGVFPYAKTTMATSSTPFDRPLPITTTLPILSLFDSTPVEKLRSNTITTTSLQPAVSSNSTKSLQSVDGSLSLSHTSQGSSSHQAFDVSPTPSSMVVVP